MRNNKINLGSIIALPVIAVNKLRATWHRTKFKNKNNKILSNKKEKKNLIYSVYLRDPFQIKHTAKGKTRHKIPTSETKIYAYEKRREMPQMVDGKLAARTIRCFFKKKKKCHTALPILGISSSQVLKILNPKIQITKNPIP